MSDETTTTTTVDENTTTTTTVDPALANDRSEQTTTTTQVQPSQIHPGEDRQEPDRATTSDTTVVTAAAATAPLTEKRGEVAINGDARAHELQEQPAEERLDDARNQGLANHAHEHANDPQNEANTTSRDAA